MALYTAVDTVSYPYGDWINYANTDPPNFTGKSLLGSVSYTRGFLDTLQVFRETQLQRRYCK